MHRCNFRTTITAVDCEVLLGIFFLFILPTTDNILPWQSEWPNKPILNNSQDSTFLIAASFCVLVTSKHVFKSSLFLYKFQKCTPCAKANAAFLFATNDSYCITTAYIACECDIDAKARDVRTSSRLNVVDASTLVIVCVYC